jgi:hypothetical protein
LEANHAKRTSDDAEDLASRTGEHQRTIDHGEIQNRGRLSKQTRSLGKIQTVRIFNLSFPEMGVDLSGVFPNFA